MPTTKRPAKAVSSKLDGATIATSLVPVKSSNLAAVGYDPETRLLTIAFKNGSVYQYQGLSGQIHFGLMAAPSKGKFSTKIFAIFFTERSNRDNALQP